MAGPVTGGTGRGEHGIAVGEIPQSTRPGVTRLNWGLLPAFDSATAGHVPWDLAREWQVAEESLGLVARPVERFELAGTLNEHPGHVRSDEAKKDFPAIFALAVVGRTGPEPLRARSRATAAAALLAWARAYRPGTAAPGKGGVP